MKKKVPNTFDMDHPNYIYQRIDLARDAIRLIRLRKGHFLRPLVCEIFESYLDREEGVPYEALSYAWGDLNAERVPIDITERQGAQTRTRILKITKNLNDALKHLRRQDEDRVLWVDAICIDQGNQTSALKERTHQVQQMRLVYERAERVIVWLGALGLGIQSTSSLMAFANELDRRAMAFTTRTSGTYAWESKFLELKEDCGYSGRDCKTYEDMSRAMGELLDRPWFRRIWVIQEVASAKTGLVVCGKDGFVRTAHMRTFALLPSLMQVKIEPHVQAILEVMPLVGQQRKGWWIEKHDLQTLLLKFRNNEASDPRDYVYALLGISSCRHDRDAIETNYEISSGKLFWKTIVFLATSIPRVGIHGPDSAFETSKREFYELLDDPVRTHHVLLDWALDNCQFKVASCLLGIQDVEIDHDDHECRPPLVLSPAVREAQGLHRISEAKSTLLRLAAMHNQPQLVRKLLMHRDLNINQTKMSTVDSSPILLASARGHEQIVRLLLGRDDIEVNYQGTRHRHTPLRVAVRSGHTRIVKLLLEHGAFDVNGPDLTEPSLLCLAADRPCLLLNEPHLVQEGSADPSTEIIKLLVEYDGADKNPGGDQIHQALLWAIHHGNKSSESLLLRKFGLDIDVMDKAVLQKIFPWFLTDAEGHDAGGKTLLGAPAQFGEHLSLSVMVQAPEAVIARDQNETNSASHLSKYGHFSPLKLAAFQGDAGLVQHILESGQNDVDPDAEHKTGYGTALWAAASRGHYEVVKLLIGHGCQVDLKDYIYQEGMQYDVNYAVTPLWQAANKGFGAIVALLISAGADMETRGRIQCKYPRYPGYLSGYADGELAVTPLWQAAHKDHQDTVMTLLSRGADSKARSQVADGIMVEKDPWGDELLELRTPLEEADACRHKGAHVEMLRIWQHYQLC